MLCELLWIIMQLDLDRLKNRADNSEELANLAQDSTKRMVRNFKLKIVAMIRFNLILSAYDEGCCEP